MHAISAILSGATTVSTTLRCKVGEKLTPMGKVSPLWASVRLEAPSRTIDEALDKLAALGDLAVNVRIPSMEAGSLKLTLSPVMPARRVAVLFAYIGELDTPGALSDEDVATELAACGIHDTAGVKS